MVNIHKLKGVIVEKGTTQEAVAYELGMNRSTFYRRMQDGGRFTVAEVQKMVEFIPLTPEEASSTF